ncbi:MAG TPA: PCRF domain-containing protein, partial [Pseudolabrys sp.]
MITLPQQKLDALLARHALVESELASGLSPDAYVRLSREFAELGPAVDAIKAYRSADKEIAELSALVDDSSTDAEMRKLADAERQELRERREKLAEQIRLALLPKDAMDNHNAILEIRAGTGGDEAA